MNKAPFSFGLIGTDDTIARCVDRHLRRRLRGCGEEIGEDVIVINNDDTVNQDCVREYMLKLYAV